MEDAEKKALEFVGQAEKKLKSSSGILGTFMKGSNKVEDAAELYTKAGHSFKIAKKWAEAGNAYSKSANLHRDLGNKLECASHYIDAANCFKKIDRNESVNLLNKAIEVYVDMGRFTIAAKHYMEMGEIFEQEPKDLKKSIEFYQKAADFYQGEESNSSANRCLLKVAAFSAEVEIYEKSAETYEKIAISSMDNPLLRHGAKDHFFRATVCRMCQDIQDGHNAVAKYSEMCTSFAQSREAKLLKSLLEALEEKDVEKFTETLQGYDNISRLEPWFVTLFTRIKRTIETDSSLL